MHSPRFYRALLPAASGWASPTWTGCGTATDLVALTRIAALNVRALDMPGACSRRCRSPSSAGCAGSRATRRDARASAIAAHYDLGNELFSLFLDPTMMYSCAIFERPRRRSRRPRWRSSSVCARKLDLGPDDHVLEIGSGWGGFAVYAAEHYGCHVTTTTISREQHAYTLRGCARPGLEDRVTVLLEDYRDLRGRYDKLVSIEMIEAVGWQYLGTFFRRCSRAAQARRGDAAAGDHHRRPRLPAWRRPRKSFINTYIFPGGCLPSMEAISRVARARDRPAPGAARGHHRRTTPRPCALARALPGTPRAAAELGYDERFRRLWELYLCWCEGGFRERRIQDVQLLLAKPGYRSERCLPAGAAGLTLTSVSTRLPADPAGRALASASTHEAIGSQPREPSAALSLSASSTK